MPGRGVSIDFKSTTIDHVEKCEAAPFQSVYLIAYEVKFEQIDPIGRYLIFCFL